MTHRRQGGLFYAQGSRGKGTKAAVLPKPKTPPLRAEVGLILMDPSLNIIASDWGAASILNHRSQPGAKQTSGLCLPEEILELLRGRKLNDRSPVKTHLRVDKNEYICRIYLLESQDDPVAPVVALHLERDSSTNDVICELVKKYHLTVREQEVLRGISLGLATKEMAERMSISPNTVKAFLRLVMIKMGVTKRAGVVAHILHGASTDESETVSPIKKRAAGASI